MLIDFCRYLIFGILTLGSVLIIAGISELASGQVNLASFASTLIRQVLPMAFLVAALFSVGIRSRYSEIIAFNSAGVSLAQVTWPLLIPAVVGFLSSIALLLIESPELVTQQGAEWPTGDQSQLAIAKSSLIFTAVLVGTVLASGKRRRTVSSGFISAIVVLVVYYLIEATALALGKHSSLPSVMVIWLPVAVTGVPALVIWLRGGWR